MRASLLSLVLVLGACRGPVVEAVPMCDDQGSLRPTVAPVPGDLVIDEIMADPTKVPDTTGEWFEVAVRTDVDLNHLEVGNLPGEPKLTISDAECRHVTAGSFLVFARADDPALNGGLPQVDFVIPASIVMPNSQGSLAIGIDGALLDAVAWASTQPGVAAQLDPGELVPAIARGEPGFCPATAAYGDGDLGTPGSANDACPSVIPSDMCSDGGVLRRIHTPLPNDLLIDEFLADPRGADAGKEWFEVYVVNEVDLNGLQAGIDPEKLTTTLTSGDCLHAAAGSYLVFAQSPMAEVNGGLPQVDYLFDFSLVNDAGGLALVDGGVVIDAITYDATSEGFASGDDPTNQSFTAGGQNVFCLAQPTDNYGTNGDKGTPGQANPACP